MRGRAPASAAIRFELVVHVQAPDRREVVVVVRRAAAAAAAAAAADSMYARYGRGGEQQRAACNIHAEGMSE